MLKNYIKKQEFLLAVLTISVYGITVLNGFVFDDARAVVLNSSIKSWDNFMNVILSVRGVRSVTYMFDYSLFGLTPTGYHAHNIVWQLAAVLLTYRFLDILIRDKNIVLLAALVFALHPLHVEAVANVSNRKEMICFVFYLASLINYMHIFAVKDQKKRITRALLSALFFILAIASKEVAITLPVFFVIYELLFVKAERRLLMHRRYSLLKLVFFLAAISFSVTMFSEYLFFNKESYYIHYRLPGNLLDYTYILNNVFAVFVYYIRHFLFPANLLADYFIPVRGGLGSWPFILLITCFSCYLYLIYISYRKNRAICFALIWFIVNYVVISPLNLAVYPLCDRYLYLPSLGLSMLSGFALSQFLTLADAWPGRLISIVLSSILFLCLAALSVNYSTYWKDEITLWENTLKKNPESKTGRLLLAVRYLSTGRLDKVEEQILKMGDLDPRAVTSKHAAMILSEKYYLSREKAKAFEVYRSVVAAVDHKNPNITYPYIEKFAGFFKESGFYKEALKAYGILEAAGYKKDEVSMQIKSLRRMLEDQVSEKIKKLKKLIFLNPGDIRPMVNLGIVYYGIMDYDEAEKTFKRALPLAPDSFELRYNLGLVYTKSLRFDAAALEFEKAVSLRARVPAVVFDNLGLAYLKLGREKEAIEQFLRAIKADKEFALSYLHLASCYRKRGDYSMAIDAYRMYLLNSEEEEYYRSVVERELKDLLLLVEISK